MRHHCPACRGTRRRATRRRLVRWLDAHPASWLALGMGTAWALFALLIVGGGARV